jgi:hypothetical protein
LKPIERCPWSSLLKRCRKLCLKMEVGVQQRDHCWKLGWLNLRRTESSIRDSKVGWIANTLGSLVALHRIPFNFTMWLNRFLQLITDHSGAFGRGSSSKRPDASTSVGIGRFQKPNSNAKSHAGESKRTFVVGNRLRVRHETQCTHTCSPI